MWEMHVRNLLSTWLSSSIATGYILLTYQIQECSEVSFCKVFLMGIAKILTESIQCLCAHSNVHVHAMPPSPSPTFCIYILTCAFRLRNAGHFGVQNNIIGRIAAVILLTCMYIQLCGTKYCDLPSNVHSHDIKL